MKARRSEVLLAAAVTLGTLPLAACQSDQVRMRFGGVNVEDGDGLDQVHVMKQRTETVGDAIEFVEKGSSEPVVQEVNSEIRTGVVELIVDGSVILAMPIDDNSLLGDENGEYILVATEDPATGVAFQCDGYIATLDENAGEFTLVNGFTAPLADGVEDPSDLIVGAGFDPSKVAAFNVTVGVDEEGNAVYVEGEQFIADCKVERGGNRGNTGQRRSSVNNGRDEE